ncbi:hypothetical protein BD311DRAFT_489180 [Dichomitus squalens]|uniref:Uncharacterized protein n=1 Tax=Dichomitus squalens TaxID=114155 RepID=A0A4Q9MG57_9APHY|nr:hypothetical protein BD311DRAFT_489180 [Dichomitus squalens]
MPGRWKFARDPHRTRGGMYPVVRDACLFEIEHLLAAHAHRNDICPHDTVPATSSSSCGARYTSDRARAKRDCRSSTSQPRALGNGPSRMHRT